MQIVLYIIIGLVLGVIIGYLVAKIKNGALVAQCTVLKSENENIKTHNRELLEAQELRHDEAMAAMKESFEMTIEHLKANIKASTEDILKRRQEEFSDLNKRNMQGIVDPLNETIEKMKLAMADYTKEQSEFKGSMDENLRTIISQTETTRRSAEELTTALKHDTKIQGDYGEAILDEILSSQGFTKGIHYDLQYVIRDDEGKEIKGDDDKGMRPDVVFHIDKVRDVIIDSKMNLTDFINFANAKTPEDRKMYLEKHVKSIENQVKLLSQKNYFKFHKKTNNRMDYVIMFVPISAAWWEALRFKPSLWREAMDNNVYIADEQTLFAALRIIKLTWTQISQADTHKEVYRLADEMIKRVGMFLDSYKKIGVALATAQKSYDDANRKLVSGKQAIMTTAKQLVDLGVKQDKKYSLEGFIDIDDIEQLPEPETPNT